MTTKWLVLVLWMAAAVANAAETNRLHLLYDEGLQLYWAGKLNESSLKLAEVVNQSPLEGLGLRAAYMMGILREKMGSNDLAVINQEIAARYPVLAAYQSAQRQLTNQPPEQGFAQMVGFTVLAPTPAWRKAGVQMLFGQDWPDEVVAKQFADVNALVDLIEEQKITTPKPRWSRLIEQLLRECVARADYTRQLQLRERILALDLTPESVINMVQIYRTAGKTAESWTCYTAMVSRVEDPGQLGAAMVLAMLAMQDTATAKASLLEAQARAGTNHTALLLAEAKLLERLYDYAGARRVLARSEDPDVLRAREELQLRIPLHYDLDWNVTVPGALDVVVDSNRQVQIYCHPGIRSEPSLLQLNEKGQPVKTIPLLGQSRLELIALHHSAPFFALHPDGSFLLGYSLYSPRGEFILTLPGISQSPFREDGAADISPTEGIAIVTRAGGGLSRFSLDGKPIFKERDPEGTRSPLCGLIWIGTNIVLLDQQRAVFYNNQGIRLRTEDWTGADRQRFSSGFSSSRAGGIRTDSSGLIYFASSAFGGVRILDHNLRFISHIAMENPAACAVACDGTVYIIHDNQIARFVPKNGGARALMKNSPEP